MSILFPKNSILLVGYNEVIRGAVRDPLSCKSGQAIFGPAFSKIDTYF